METEHETVFSCSFEIFPLFPYLIRCPKILWVISFSSAAGEANCEWDFLYSIQDPFYLLWMDPVLKLYKILNYYEQDHTSIGVFRIQSNICNGGFCKNVFNPLQILFFWNFSWLQNYCFLRKLEWNWASIFIALCICKGFSSILVIMEIFNQIKQTENTWLVLL